MNKPLIIASALVLGSSSVAMADSFSFGARASVSWRAPAPAVIVRDHRTYPYQTPAYQQPVRIHRNTDRIRWDGDQHPVIQHPVLPAGIDCRNWDPMLDTSDQCANFFASGGYYNAYNQSPYMGRGWTLLGTRESAVADNQFVTVNDGRGFSRLQLRAVSGEPVITKVAIRFTDNSVQVINLGGCLESATLNISRRPINQIVVYTAAGSRGSYSIAAL